MWRAIRAGASTLIGAVIVLGIVAAIAFDALFEVFHTIFFASGSFDFDPRTSRLVQLFPDQFWFETSIALAVVLLILGVLVRTFAGRRLRMPAAALPAPGVSVEAAR